MTACVLCAAAKHSVTDEFCLPCRYAHEIARQESIHNLKILLWIAGVIVLDVMLSVVVL